MYKIPAAILLIVFLAAPETGHSQDSLNQYDRQGQKHGLWVKTYPNGQEKYRGHFEHGEPQGTFKRYFSNGNTMAMMDHSHPGGVYAQLFNKQGQKQAEGLYVNQKKDSIWVFYNSNGRLVMQESYDMGRRNGRSVKFFPDGDTSHVTTWRNGQRHGVYKQYFPNGRIKLMARYEQGELDGPFTIYFPDGFKEIFGAYRNNLRHGKWVYMDSHTDTARVVQYEHGEPLNEEAMELKEYKEIQQLENNQGKFGDPREIVMPERRRRNP